MSETAAAKPLLTRVLTPLASLRIAVTLIAFTLLLVFAGTTAQKDFGAWDVQRDYFYTWGVVAPAKYFFPLMSWSETLPTHITVGSLRVPFGLPLPGGYTIALAMLLNLTAAHIVRFKITWRDLLVIPPLVALMWWVGNQTYGYGYYILSGLLIVASLPLIGAMYWLHGKRGGVHLIHLGLILVLGGEMATSVVKVEQMMPINEGGYANYAFDTRYAELAVIDTSDPKQNKVTVIEEKRLKPGATIQHADLPFEVKIDAYYPNSTRVPLSEAKPDAPKATAGLGLQLAVESRPKADGIGKAPPDAPGGYVTLVSRAGQDLGRYALCEHLPEQAVTVDGKPYQIALRWPRYYKEFQLHLKDFRFDRHTGSSTDMAKNFSSLVRLVDAEKGEDREVKIWMNHPLRHRGETFYQASFDETSETQTILQVVKNPSWLFPYIACVVGGLGMAAHFGVNLLAFGRKRAKSMAEALTAQANAAASKPGKQQRKEQYTLPPRYGPGYTWVPIGVVALCVVYLVYVLMPPPVTTVTGLDLKSASSIPMNYEGRVLPFDTLARVSLKVITGGKEDLSKVIKEKDQPKPPGVQVLLDAFTRNERGRQYEMFKIDNAEVVGLMGLKAVNPKDGTDRQYFSWAELEPSLEKLRDQVVAVAKVDDKHLTAFQRELGELWKQVKTFDNLVALTTLYLMPPTTPGGEWRQAREVLAAEAAGKTDTALAKFRAVLMAYDECNPANPDKPVAPEDAKAKAEAFAKAVDEYKAHVASVDPKASSKAGVEVFFNRVAPFYHLTGFYVLAFVLVMLSFLFAPAPLRRAAMWVLVLTLVIHTGGLIFRMYLQGRPPVTTLYSSAIFIAWGGALLALCAEWFFKNGTGLLSSAVMGFGSLFIAHNLSLTDGDSLRELQAVLDTNFWLATHVVLITLGYASTFLAAALAEVYILRGVLTPTLNKTAGKELLRMVYGILCFAMLFSFVGTVLGGIWADQSWGRFWGWDPKENGAILIVLWNALILHARWGGMIKERGVMVLAVFGSVVTAWSYFGTNELGVGLHAYGFQEGTRYALGVFAVSQIGLMVLGLLPIAWWSSGRALADSPDRPKTA